MSNFSDTLLESQPRATGWMSTQNPFETRAMELDFPKNARKCSTFSSIFRC